MSHRCYADDTQIYSAKPNNLNQLSSLHECWLPSKTGCLLTFSTSNSNPDKTEIILFGPDKLVTAIGQFIGPLRTNIKPTAKNLGFTFDQTFHLHVTKLVQLQNVATIKRFLSSRDLEQLINQSHLTATPSTHAAVRFVNRLQLVQNAAARLLTRTSRRSHITPVLASLHCLPVKFRINYKILLITYEALHDLDPVTCQTSLFLIPLLGRSSNLSLLSVPRSTCKSKGDLRCLSPNIVD